jgi:hypothetical protein
MKDCPLKIEDCETCRWKFGPRKCGIFSIAMDMSVLSEEGIPLLKELVKLLKRRPMESKTKTRKVIAACQDL